MADIISTASAGFRSLILADPAIANYVRSTNGSFKVFKSTAEGNFKAPYILMAKLYGGEDNSNPVRSFDMIFRIGAVTVDQVLTEELAGLIETALVGKWPVMNGWTAWAAITQVQPFNEGRVIQAVPHYESGAQYRIRATKN